MNTQEMTDRLNKLELDRACQEFARALQARALQEVAKREIYAKSKTLLIKRSVNR